MIEKKNNLDPIRASDTYYHSSTTYNDRLDAQHVDVPVNDESVTGQLIRSVTSLIGGCFSPKALIVVFRLLKAWTFCCLCFTIATEVIYLFFVELQVSNDVLKKIGGSRDEVLRAYGIVLAFGAIFIELDMTIVDTHCPLLKGFLPRSILLMFITALSGTSPIIAYENYILKNSQSNNYDDDGYIADSASISKEVPGSAVAFQTVTAFLLFLSTCLYFIMGLLCLDRFTADAFLSDDDPAAGTSIRNDSDRGTDANLGFSDDEGSYDIDIAASSASLDATTCTTGTNKVR